MKEDKNQKTIWTIGHSTHPIDEFISMLQSFSIKVLVDIRHYPGSKRYPHFNKEALEISLPAENIQYMHMIDLGGRRKPVVGSINTAWRNDAFRGYADYMQTDQFKTAVHRLEEIGSQNKTAYMCSEAVWWSCHRSLVSDYLKINGWQVMHIMAIGKAQEHPYTSAARIVNDELRYDKPELFE